MINRLKGRLEIAKFKWNKSKLKWPMVACILIGLFLAWNGDYGYVPSGYCSVYPFITYGIVLLPLLAWLVEIGRIENKNKILLNEIRSKYGFKIKA